MVLYMSIIVIG